jgi:hypothetical protein
MTVISMHVRQEQTSSTDMNSGCDYSVRRFRTLCATTAVKSVLGAVAAVRTTIVTCDSTRSGHTTQRK